MIVRLPTPGLAGEIMARPTGSREAALGGKSQTAQAAQPTTPDRSHASQSLRTDAKIAVAPFTKSSSMSDCIRIAMIDSGPLHTEGIALDLFDAPNLELVAEGTAVNELACISARQGVDVALVVVDEIHNDPGNLIEALHSSPNLHTIVISKSEEWEVVVSLIQHGARGYLLTKSSSDELARSIKAVQSGGLYITPSLGAALILQAGYRDTDVDEMSGLIHLRHREREVLGLLARGHTNKEIANALSLTESMVKHDVEDVMRKLNVRSRIEAALTVATKVQKL
jgi:two-component system nitrate/nitrite response regulator NarL